MAKKKVAKKTARAQYIITVFAIYAGERQTCSCNTIYTSKKEAIEHAVEYNRDTESYKDVRIHRLDTGEVLKVETVVTVGGEEYRG